MTLQYELPDAFEIIDLHILTAIYISIDDNIITNLIYSYLTRLQQNMTPCVASGLPLNNYLKYTHVATEKLIGVQRLKRRSTTATNPSIWGINLLLHVKSLHLKSLIPGLTYFESILVYF